MSDELVGEGIARELNEGVPEMTNAELDRWIAEHVMGWSVQRGQFADGRAWAKIRTLDGQRPPFRDFTTDHSAAHAAWMRLTPDQKSLVVHEAVDRQPIIDGEDLVNILDATPEQLIRWIYEALVEESAE